jgi:chromosome segregation protein
LDVDQKLRETRRSRDELSRDIGRLEGQITFAQKHKKVVSGESIPLSEVRSLTEDIEKVFYDVSEHSLENIKDALTSAIKKAKDLCHSFFEKHEEKDNISDLKELEFEKDKLDLRLKELDGKEKEYAQIYKKLQDEIEATKDKGRDAERDVFKITADKNKIDGILRDLSRDEEIVSQLDAEFKRDMQEGITLAGREILQYLSFPIYEEDAISEQRDEQERRKREIEKIKIRVEEIGGGSSEEVLKEYNEANERDKFLEREILDLNKSVETLNGIISDLDDKLAEKFKDGIAKINKEFQHFFEVLFDGGNASLSVFDKRKSKKIDTSHLLISEEVEIDEEEVESGIDIAVSLPRKKIKGLQMLSGGERALTSIALLFAMSQVNPPPFLVLDETEAALDEANSRKYSAMIKDLSKKTQLILISHNRETMSVAGVLYGVTMGSDGISKLISVKLEEAVQVAK